MLVRRSFVAVLVISCLTVIGCGGDGGPPLSAVKGVVKYNGTPVSGAAVTFIYESGQISSGTTDGSGAYTMTTTGRPGAPIGKAKVTVGKVSSGGATPNMASPKPEDMMKMQMEMAKKGAPATPKSELPEKYQDQAKSGLTADVVAGGADKNSFEFTLVD